MAGSKYDQNCPRHEEGRGEEGGGGGEREREKKYLEVETELFLCLSILRVKRLVFTLLRVGESKECISTNFSQTRHRITLSPPA